MAPSSSTQDAVPFDATTGIFLSPEEVVITLASCLNIFSSRSPSTKVFSNSSGTKYPPSLSVPILSAF